MGILRGLSQLGTVAGGFMREQDAERERKIQDEELAMRREEHDYRREQRQNEREARTGLKDAYAQRTTAQEGMAIGEPGSQQFYAGNSLTPEMQDSMRAEAEMRGEATGKPPALSQARAAYGVTGGTKGQIMQDKPNIEALNSPEAQDSRAVAALRMSGKPLEAMQLQAGKMGLENSALGIKKTKADMENTERERVAERATNEIMGAVTPEDIATAITKQEGYGLKGVSATVALSPDGKTWGLKTTMPDGTEKVIPTQFANDPAGMRAAQMALLGRANPKMAMELMKMTDEQKKTLFDQKIKEKELGMKEVDSARQGRLADSTIGLQGEQAKYYKSQAWLKDVQAEAGGYRLGGGAGGKVDHFDEKEWSSAYGKMDKTAVSIPNEMGDKEVVHPDLSAARRAIFNEVRAAGGHNPAQAVEIADEKVLALRRRAMDMVEAAKANDKKSTLTVDKAITDLLRRAQSAGGQSRQPDTPPPQTTLPAAKPAAGLAAATQYTPPPNTLAAKALQERKAAQENIDAQRAEAASIQAKKLIDDEAALKMQAEEYKRRNNLR